MTGRNIMGYIEGTDKKNEILILTAHYDHIGMRGKDVFNGADDNASGSSTLTQIARAFQVAKTVEKAPEDLSCVYCLLGRRKVCWAVCIMLAIQDFHYSKQLLISIWIWWVG